MTNEDNYAGYCDLVVEQGSNCTDLVVVIEHVTRSDWQRLIECLSATDMDVAWKAQDLPDDVLPPRSESPIEDQLELELRTGPLAMRCRYLAADQVIIVINAADIRDAAAARIVLRLMSTLGRLLESTTRLVRDRETGNLLLRYQPGQGLSQRE